MKVDTADEPINIQCSRTTKIKNVLWRANEKNYANKNTNKKFLICIVWYIYRYMISMVIG